MPLSPQALLDSCLPHRFTARKLGDLAIARDNGLDRALRDMENQHFETMTTAEIEAHVDLSPYHPGHEQIAGVPAMLGHPEDEEETDDVLRGLDDMAPKLPPTSAQYAAAHEQLMRDEEAGDAMGLRERNERFEQR